MTVSPLYVSPTSSTLNSPISPIFNSVCNRCKRGFTEQEIAVVVENTRWHTECFCCAQCFLPLSDSVYYRQDDRLYCEHDFHVLYAPICYTCGHFITGRVKKALNRSYHARCFKCEECTQTLEDGVWHSGGKALCKECKDKIPKEMLYLCTICKHGISPEDLLRRGHDFFHAYHLDCAECKSPLTKTARELRGQLFCLRCFDMKCEVCSSCKKVIDPQEERSVYAMEKHWHVDHFVCSTCGKPFLGKEHFEKEGKAFCEEHYLQKYGDYCFICQKGLTGTSVRLFGKGWCAGCYRCCTCDVPLSHKDKVLEWDLRPMCKRCFKHKSFKKALNAKEQ